MELFELIFCSALASVFFVIAWFLLKRQRVTLIHDYHYTHVRKKDIPAYTKLYGCAMVCIGAGILTVGIVSIVTKTQWGWAGFAALFAAGIGLMTKAQIKYNR